MHDYFSSTKDEFNNRTSYIRKDYLCCPKQNLMKRHWLYIAVLAALCACSQKPTEAQTSDGASRQSNDTILVAIDETLASLPLVYADDKRMWAEQGLPVKYQSYSSTKDCAEALRHNEVDLAVIEAEHYDYLLPHNPSLAILGHSYNYWGIISPSILRLKRVKDLENRIVGVSRNATSQAVCNEQISLSKTNTKQMAFPQIDSPQTAYNMIINNQIDAIVLPEPFLAKALAMGGRMLMENNKPVLKKAYIVFDSQRKDQLTATAIEKIKKVYAAASDSVNVAKKQDCTNLLAHRFHLTTKEIEKLNMPARK